MGGMGDGSSDNSRVLVTGAAGFVGRAAVAALVRRGLTVVGAGRRAKPRGLGGRVEWVRQDLLAPGGPEAAVREAGAGRLLHLGWVATPGVFWESPANADWLDASRELLGVFRARGGDRAVGVGTCAEYDWSEEAVGARAGGLHETESPCHPSTTYGRSKLALSEDWLGEPGAAWARLFFMHGPGEPREKFVASIVSKLLRGEEAAMGSGRVIRDLMHVDEVGEVLAAMVAGEVDGAVNVASGEGVSLADVAGQIAGEIGREDLLRIGALPDREGEPGRLVADVGRLRHTVGFAPRLGLGEGLRATVEWWRKELASYEDHAGHG